MPEFLAQLQQRLDLAGRVSFPLSLALHIAVVALLVILPGDEPGEQIEPQRPREVVLLTAPPPELYRAPLPEPKPIAEPQPPAPRTIAPPAAPQPKPAPEQTEHVPPQRAHLEIEPLRTPGARTAAVAPIDAPRLSERRPADGLAANLEPAPEVAKPRLVVQEAGFTGAVERRALEREPMLLTTGLFGSAEAASGSGPERPAGKVVTAGFGGVEPSENHAAPRRAVQSGRFSAATAKKPAAKPRSVTPPKTSSTQPVRVLSKPTPAYTEQARALRIEGETTLEALFRADGGVEVLRVVRGLGHGLDENAVAAALAIRFEPARRDGKPVDSIVQIRIRFEMAY